MFPVVPSCSTAGVAAAVCGRLLSSLHLTLIGKQILDVLLLQRTRRAAGRAHIQGAGKLAPLLVLVDLSGLETTAG